MFHSDNLEPHTQTCEVVQKSSTSSANRRRLQYFKDAIARVLAKRENTGSNIGQNDSPENVSTSLHTFGQSILESDEIEDLEPVFRSARNTPRTTLHPIQEWEGYVVEIGCSEFTAHLVDLTSGQSSSATEEAIIPKEEISDLDASKMQVGSVFRWVIGYERSIAGTTKQRVSKIVFRDLGVVTKSDIEQGRKWAQQTVDFFAS